MSARHDGSAGAGFSLARFVAIALKELVQMRRDRLTFAMIVGIPILQLVRSIRIPRRSRRRSSTTTTAT